MITIKHIQELKEIEDFTPLEKAIHTICILDGKQIDEVLTEKNIDYSRLKQDRDEMYARWLRDTASASLGNIEQAKEIRARYRKN